MKFDNDKIKINSFINYNGIGLCKIIHIGTDHILLLIINNSRAGWPYSYAIEETRKYIPKEYSNNNFRFWWTDRSELLYNKKDEI